MAEPVSAPAVLLDQDGIQQVVKRLADELSARYDDGLVLVAVLRGSVPFLADLVRAMSIRTTVDFVALSPYAPGTGRVRLVMDAATSVEGRDVVIVEDIVDEIQNRFRFARWSIDRPGGSCPLTSTLLAWKSKTTS
jgi:hypoxanthine phosphoribosyltransferase